MKSPGASPPNLSPRGRVRLLSACGAEVSFPIEAEVTGLLLEEEALDLPWRHLFVDGPEGASVPFGRVTLHLRGGVRREFDVLEARHACLAWGLSPEALGGARILSATFRPAYGVTLGGKELVFGNGPRPGEDFKLPSVKHPEVFESLQKALARADAEISPHLPAPEKAHRVSVPCSRPGCGHATVFPLGTTDPHEGVCAHEFSLDRSRARMGAFVCRGCRLEVPAEALLDAGLGGRRYDHAGNDLADTAGKLRDEVNTLLVENAKLRRSLEDLRRRSGGGRK